MRVVTTTQQLRLPMSLRNYGDAQEVVVERRKGEVWLAFARAGIDAHYPSNNYGMIYEWVHDMGVYRIRATPTVTLEEIEAALDARSIPHKRQPAQRAPLA